ncbi:MAG: hypothetical protein U1C55_08020 [Smithellaceae bacterium]|nr:hypothetical protein [Smithellaceae bacterium]
MKRHKLISSDLFKRFTVFTWAAILLATVVLSLSSCAPTMYSVDVKYLPEKAPKAGKETWKVAVTVASFNDQRGVKEPLVLGRVNRSDGTSVPILPKEREIHLAVSHGIRDYLFDRGFSLSGALPSWDLREETISKEWGDLLVGGSIVKMEIITNDDTLLKSYRGKVELAIVLADVKKGRIIYNTTAASDVSLDYAVISEKKMEEIINTALRDVLDRIFAGRLVNQAIRSLEP